MFFSTKLWTVFMILLQFRAVLFPYKYSECHWKENICSLEITFLLTVLLSIPFNKLPFIVHAGHCTAIPEHQPYEIRTLKDFFMETFNLLMNLVCSKIFTLLCHRKIGYFREIITIFLLNHLHFTIKLLSLLKLAYWCRRFFFVSKYFIFNGPQF